MLDETVGELSRRLVCAIALAGVLVACGNKLSLADCRSDQECSKAYEILLSANRAVANTCPRDPQKTSSGCQSALATMDTAEGELFPRLKDDDALQVSAGLMSNR